MFPATLPDQVSMHDVGVFLIPDKTSKPDTDSNIFWQRHPVFTSLKLTCSFHGGRSQENRYSLFNK